MVEPPVDAAVRCEGFQVIGTSRYQLSTDGLTWAAAAERCSGQAGAYLVMFETPAEVTAVVQGLSLPADAWTGVIQKKPANRIRDNWINSPAGTAIPGNFPWDTGEPNDGGGIIPGENGEEDVAELHPNGRFNDQHPEDLNRALCECEP